MDTQSRDMNSHRYLVVLLLSWIRRLPTSHSLGLHLDLLDTIAETYGDWNLSLLLRTCLVHKLGTHNFRQLWAYMSFLSFCSCPTACLLYAHDPGNRNHVLVDNFHYRSSEDGTEAFDEVVCALWTVLCHINWSHELLYVVQCKIAEAGLVILSPCRFDDVVCEEGVEGIEESAVGRTLPEDGVFAEVYRLWFRSGCGATEACAE